MNLQPPLATIGRNPWRLGLRHTQPGPPLGPMGGTFPNGGDAQIVYRTDQILLPPVLPTWFQAIALNVIYGKHTQYPTWEFLRINRYYSSEVTHPSNALARETTDNTELPGVTLKQQSVAKTGPPRPEDLLSGLYIWREMALVGLATRGHSEAARTWGQEVPTSRLRCEAYRTVGGGLCPPALPLSYLPVSDASCLLG